MAAGTSLICDTTILSDCSYRFFFYGLCFFGQISSIPFFAYCFVRKHVCVKTSRKYDTSFPHESKQIKVFCDTICQLFLGDNPTFFYFRDVPKHGC